MEVYHGSNQIIDSPKLLMPTHPLDFGVGFYATTNCEQATAFAKKVVRWRGGKSKDFSINMFSKHRKR
jgi:hypothetical protein